MFERRKECLSVPKCSDSSPPSFTFTRLTHVSCTAFPGSLTVSVFIESVLLTSSQRSRSGLLSATLSHKHRVFCLLLWKTKLGLVKEWKMTFREAKAKVWVPHSFEHVMELSASFLSDFLFWVLCFLSVSDDALSPQEDGPGSSL